MIFNLLMALLLFLGPMPARASDSKAYSLGTQVIVLERTKEGDLVSQVCIQKPCEAKRLLKNIRMPSDMAEKARGGANPGSILCRVQPDAEVVIARDPQGNQMSLCRFKKDQSLVSSASLHRRAILNSALR